MDQRTSRDSNTTMMALAALMFFSPFVHYVMSKGAVTLVDNERSFVWGYVKLGYINRVFLLLTIASGIGNYFITSDILPIIYAIAIGIVLIMLLVGSLCVLSNVSLTIQKDFTLKFYEVGDKQSLLLKFLPLYNVYLRYKLHTFDTPNRWVKESLLWRTFFILFALTTHPLILSVIIVLRILRIATLMSGIDVLHIQAKSDISALFFKNPEEIRGYVTGFIIFIGKSIAKILHTPKNEFTLHTCIQAEKDAYSRLYNIKTNREIRMQYIIGGGLVYLYRYIIQPDLTQRYSYLPLALIIGRYLIMLVTRSHLPSLPLAREIWLIISSPFRLLVRKHADVQD